jgi:hypothetical protein
MGALTGLVQESLVALLLFDSENGDRVRSIVPPEVYDSPYRGFAKKATAFWDKFKEPPGEHAIDICEQLEQEDPRQADITRRIFDSIQQCKDGINAKYVLARTAEFIRGQGLRAGIIMAVELLEADKLDEAEVIIQKAIKGGLDVFHPGLLFSQLSLRDMLTEDVEVFPTGIKQLDERKLGPAIGELHLLIAPSNYGKSFWLMQLAKTALINHKRVVYITLEMSEKKVATRFLQSFYCISKRKEKKLVHRVFEENDAGQFCGIDVEELEDVNSLSDIMEDRELEKKLRRKHARFRRRSPLVIRQFPTGSLTTQQLVGYLESLEAQQGIAPDLLLVDYPDLMHMDGKQEHRIALGRIFQELRGIAIDRNLALATVSQTNRQALGKNLITEKDVAEDYSKIATSDVALSYNQTEEERKLGLARLHVMKARNEEKGFTMLLSQDYSIGQFCISSVRMASIYWAKLKAEIEGATARRRERL